MKTSLAAKTVGTVLVTGARNPIGAAIVLHCLGNGYNVIATSSSQYTKEMPSMQNLHWEQVDFRQKETHSPDYWQKLVTRIEADHGKVSAVVDTVGIGLEDPKNGLTFENINYKSVSAMAEGCARGGEPRHFVGISHFAAAVNAAVKGDKAVPYIQSKYKAEQALHRLENEGKLENMSYSFFRPDLIISAKDPTHAFSPQRLTGLPIKILAAQTLPKAGKILMQPVFVDDLASAVVNMIEASLAQPVKEERAHHKQIVNAVGPEVFTLSDFMNFFKKLRGEDYLFQVRVPVKAIIPFAELHPDGALELNHLQLLGILEDNPRTPIDPTEFQQIAGKKSLTTISEAFNQERIPIFAKIEVVEYVAGLLKSGIDWQTAGKLMKAICTGLIQSKWEGVTGENKGTPFKHSMDNFNFVPTHETQSDRHSR